jgi:hypothetical protein
LAVGGAALAFLLWYSVLPDPLESAPSTLTRRDQREIGRLCRKQTLYWIGARLRRGDLGAVRLGVSRLFRQKIHRFIDDRDGTYRVYVVVYDRSDPDGFVPWYRHQVARTNGTWRILRSY